MQSHMACALLWGPAPAVFLFGFLYIFSSSGKGGEPNLEIVSCRAVPAYVRGANPPHIGANPAVYRGQAPP